MNWKEGPKVRECFLGKYISNEEEDDEMGVENGNCIGAWARIGKASRQQKFFCLVAGFSLP